METNMVPHESIVLMEEESANESLAMSLKKCMISLFQNWSFRAISLFFCYQA
jgi:hypothetical protein